MGPVARRVVAVVVGVPLVAAAAWAAFAWWIEGVPPMQSTDDDWLFAWAAGDAPAPWAEVEERSQDVWRARARRALAAASETPDA